MPWAVLRLSGFVSNCVKMVHLLDRISEKINLKCLTPSSTAPADELLDEVSNLAVILNTTMLFSSHLVILQNTKMFQFFYFQ